MLNQLVSTAGLEHSPVSPEIEKKITQMIKGSKGSIDGYNLTKFARHHMISVKSTIQFKEVNIDLSSVVQENQVLSGYPGMKFGILESWIKKLFDI